MIKKITITDEEFETVKKSTDELLSYLEKHPTSFAGYACILVGVIETLDKFFKDDKRFKNVDFGLTVIDNLTHNHKSNEKYS